MSEQIDLLISTAHVDAWGKSRGVEGLAQTLSWMRNNPRNRDREKPPCVKIGSRYHYRESVLEAVLRGEYSN